MILFQIDAQGVTVLEFEGNAPWPVDMHRVALRFAMKGVEVPSWQVHVLGS
mgnify:CR=1 FL=1